MFAQRFVFLMLICSTGILHAHEVDNRHGVIPDNKHGFVFEGGLTVTSQFSNAKHANNEILASFDLFGNAAIGSGQLSIYLEGNLSPSGRGIASQLSIANADAGSALNKNGNGRLQLSELHYSWPFASGEVYLGMLDPTRFLDGSDIANDETQQFIGAGFVNNPVIDFPDYTLGAAWHYTANDDQPGFAVFLSSSNGLGDNPSTSYEQLINVHDKNKGLFAAAELYYPWRNLNIRSGIWLNSAKYSRINSPDKHAKNFGFYTSIDLRSRQHSWNIRYGITNPKVSTDRQFAAIAYQYQFAHTTVGLGIAHLHQSDQSQVMTNSPNTQAELYVRLNPVAGLSITPSVQFLRRQTSNNNQPQFSQHNWVASIRLSYYF